MYIQFDCNLVEMYVVHAQNRANGRGTRCTQNGSDARLASGANRHKPLVQLQDLVPVESANASLSGGD